MFYFHSEAHQAEMSTHIYTRLHTGAHFLRPPSPPRKLPRDPVFMTGTPGCAQGSVWGLYGVCRGL